MEKKVYSTDGKELRTITLDDKVFGLPVNDDVIYYAITNELANMRVGTACTKGRAEVHGSNAKPYKQKGTGNARRGDKKSPIMVGGGTIFGPKPRDFSYSMPKKAKRLAMKSILSMQAQSDRFTVVEDFTVESGKTKDLVKILDKYKCIQIVLKEKFLGIGSKNTNEIEQVLNNWYANGYRLHTCSISHTDSKGFAGGDRLVATCILEKI